MGFTISPQNPCPSPHKATLWELSPALSPLPRTPRRVWGGDAWLLSRRCFQRLPLHSNTATGWGGWSSTPQPCSPPGAEVCVLVLPPSVVKTNSSSFLQQPCASSSPAPRVGTTPAAPGRVPQCPLSPGSRQQRGQDRGSHRRTDVRGIFFFVWSTRAPVPQDGAEP